MLHTAPVCCANGYLALYIYIRLARHGAVICTLYNILWARHHIYTLPLQSRAVYMYADIIVPHKSTACGAIRIYYIVMHSRVYIGTAAVG